MFDRNVSEEEEKQYVSEEVESGEEENEEDGLSDSP